MDLISKRKSCYDMTGTPRNNQRGMGDSSSVDSIFSRASHKININVIKELHQMHLFNEAFINAAEDIRNDITNNKRIKSKDETKETLNKLLDILKKPHQKDN